jgi:hypothetical protein
MPAGRSLAALGAAALFTASGVVAVAEIVSEYRSGPFASAARITREQRAEPVATDALVRTAAATIADGGNCAPQVLEPVGQLLAEQLDLVNEAVDYERFVDTVTTAERFYSHAVACAPASSRAWTRLALLDLVATSDLDRADSRVDVAGWNSPVFWPDLVQRVGYWKHRSLRASVSLHDGLRHDLGTLLTYARPDDVLLAVDGAGPAFRAQMGYHLTVLPPERLAELRAVGIGGPKPETPADG